MQDPTDVIRPGEEERELAQALGVLASPVRLAILEALRSPRALKEVRVGPAREEEEGAGSLLSKQGVRQHLLRLVEQGLATRRPAHREYGETVEYLVSQSALFALAERFRDVAAPPPTETPDQETWGVGERPVEGRVEGPALVLVHGIPLGARFALDVDALGESPWLLGRGSRADVDLGYDPFVSGENALLRSRDDGFLVEDVPGSRNGTRVNFRPLARGEAWELAAGDLVGVGRSLLLFRP